MVGLMGWRCRLWRDCRQNVRDFHSGERVAERMRGRWWRRGIPWVGQGRLSANDRELR